MPFPTCTTGVFRSSSKNRYGLGRFSNFIASAQAVSGVMMLVSPPLSAVQLFSSPRSFSGTQSAASWLELGGPVGRVVAGQDDCGKRRRGARIRKLRRNRLHVGGMIVPRRRRRERRRSLDQSPVILQPFTVIEGDRADDAAPLTIDGGEAALLDGALCNDHLVAEGLHADALDVDTKLTRPEGGQRQVRPAVWLEAHHVVRRDRGPEDRIVPVLQREKLVLVEHVGGARDVARDEDAVGHHAADVKCPAAGVARHAPEAGGEPSPFEPFDVPDRPERRHHDVDVDRDLVRESRPPHVSGRVAFQRLSTETPRRRSTPWSRCISAAILPITPPSAPTSGASARSATVTGSPSSRQTDATSDPMKPAPMTRTRPGLAARAFCKRAASLLVRIVYTPSSAASFGLGHSRARVPVAISRRSKGTWSPPAKCTCLFTRSRRTAALPSSHSASTSRTRGSLV